MRDVDCIVIGQGIAGTFLSFELIQAGLSVLVVDAPNPFGASRVASGVINPVTGRRVVETWEINKLLPLATAGYQRISSYLGIPSVVKILSVLAVHGNQQMADAFKKRHREGSVYIQEIEQEADYSRFFKTPYGLHGIHPALLIDLHDLLFTYRQFLEQKGFLVAAPFDWQCLQMSTSKQTPFIYHQGDVSIRAPWVIAAEGPGAAANPYFKQLAFRFNKGEALIISVPGLPREHIYKLRYTVVPWGEKDLFWVGSTYQWSFDDAMPTTAFKESVIEFLEEALLMPYQVVDHIAAVRPASVNRRPFAGVHPDYPQLGILNGLGTKGCSLAPYLSLAWKGQILQATPFDPAVALETLRH